MGSTGRVVRTTFARGGCAWQVAPEPAEAALPVGFFDDASADAKARNTTVAEDKKAQFECVNVVVMLRVSV